MDPYALTQRRGFASQSDSEPREAVDAKNPGSESVDPKRGDIRQTDPNQRDPKEKQDINKDLGLPEELLMSEVSSSEGEVQRWLSPYGQNPDPVARQKGLKLYEEMMVDEQIAVCVGLRKKAMLSVAWSVEPGKKGDATSEKYAEFVKHVLERMDGTIETDLEEIYSAIEFGFSVSELNFILLEDGPFKGKIGLKSIKTREPYNYNFKVDGHGNTLGLVYTGIVPGTERESAGRESARTGLWFLPAATVVNSSGRGLGSYENPFPMEKFVHYAYNPKFNNPYGRSDLLSAFRYWNAKRFVLKFWNVWLERYATPFMWATIDGSMVSNKKKVMDDVDDFIKNLQARSGFRAPKGVEIHVEGGQNRSGGASYEDAVEAFNRWMAHGLFCPNLMGFSGSGSGGGSGGSSGSTGSFALGKKHFEAFMWVINKMSKDTEESIIGEQVIRRLMELNFPEEDSSLYPKFRQRDVDDDQVNLRATILSTLAGGGFVNPDEEWVREYLSLPETAPGVVLQKPQPQGLFGPDGEPLKPGEEPREGDNSKEKNPEKSRDSEPKENEIEEKKKPAEMRARQFVDERPSYESKVDFKDLAESLDSAETRFARTLNEAMVSAREDFMRLVRNRGLLASSADAADVARLTFNVGSIKDAVNQWMVKLHLDSKLRALKELGRGGVPVEIVKTFDDTPNEKWEPIPPEEAIEFFNRKVVARIALAGGKKAAKKLIVLATGEELGYYADKAFAVAGIVRDDILNEAKQIILNGIKRVDLPAAEKALSELFSKYVVDGVIGPEVAAPARLATIVRTNTLDALNQGRKNLFEDPDVKGFVSYWEYSAVIDERTTDYCKCMDKKVFAMDDLGILNPPAHYNCRAISVPVTKFETRDKDVTVSKPCSDRMPSFSDIVRDPVSLMPGLTEPPTMAPQPERSASSVESDKKLKDELSQMITGCAYSTCRSSNVRFVRRMLNIGEFTCDDCNLPFRISNKGDTYLFDPGIEKWDRVTRGVLPGFFREK